MAFTVTNLWATSPYDNGLGVNTPLGTGFLRRVQVDFTAGTVAGNITAADLGGSILKVVSVIMKSTNSVYVGTETASAIPLTASGNCTAEVLALVRGL